MCSSAKKTILLVEDDIILSTVEKKMLEKFGYNVITASTGEAAIDIFNDDNDSINLVLMDIDLGTGIDGTQAAEIILNRRYLPIVFLSSHAEAEIVEKTEKITSYGYVVKGSAATVIDASIKMAFKLFEANQKIAESQIRQEALLSNISDVIAIIGHDGIIKYQSQNVKKWFGWAPEELIGIPVFNYVHPGYHAEAKKTLDTLLSKPGTSISGECMNMCKDKSYKWIEYNATNLIDDPIVNGIIYNYRDISEHKRIEESFHKTNEYLENLINYANAPIIVWDNTFTITLFNRAFEQLSGYSADEVISKKIDILFPKDKVKESLGLIKAAASGKRWESVDIEILRKDGKIRTVLWNSANIVDKNGVTIAGTIAQGQDITMRKLSENSLQLKIKQNTALLDAARFILNIEDFNKVARHIFDDCCSLIGATAGYVALLSEDGLENQVLFLETGGKGCAVDPSLPMPVRGLRAEAYKNGRAVYENNFNSSRWVKFMPHGHAKLDNVMFAPLNIDGKAVGLMGLANKPGDFTDEDARLAEAFSNLAAMSLKNSKALQMLRKNKDEIEALLFEKEMTLKEVHHRIKNNMNTVTGIMTLQMETLTEPTAIKAINDARNRVISMMVLYDKLYRSNDFQKTSFKEYISPLIDEIISNFPNKAIVNIKKNIEDFMISAKTISNIGIAINELLTNAMKYAFAGRQKGVITISASVNNNEVTIIVEDDGIGFPKSIDISNPNGFGLQLVNMLALQLRASIKIERNGGTKFTLKFNI